MGERAGSVGEKIKRGISERMGEEFKRSDPENNKYLTHELKTWKSWKKFSPLPTMINSGQSSICKSLEEEEGY